MDKKVESNNKNENSRLQGDETLTDEVTPNVDEGHYHHSRDNKVYKGEDQDQDQSWTVSASAAVQEGNQDSEEKAEEEEKEIDNANLKEKLKLKLLKDPSEFAYDWTDNHYYASLQAEGCKVDSLQLLGKPSGNREIQLKIQFGKGDMKLRNNCMNNIPSTKLTSLHVAVYFVMDIYGLLDKVNGAIEAMAASQMKQKLEHTFTKYKAVFSVGHIEYEKVKAFHRTCTGSRHCLPEDTDIAKANTNERKTPHAQFLNSKLVAGHTLAIPYGLDFKYSHNFLLLSGFTVDMKLGKVGKHASGQVEGPKEWASRYCKAPGKESYKLKNKVVENVPVVDFHRHNHTQLISQPCQGSNNFDRLAIMLNVLSDNLMITSRDFLVQMLAVLLRQPLDQLAFNVGNSYLSPEKLKLIVLDNFNAPHRFMLIKCIDTVVIKDYHQLKANHEQAKNDGHVAKAKQTHVEIKGMLADDDNGHVLKMIQDEILQEKQGPWVIAVHHMTPGQRRASKFIVVKLARDGRRIPKVQDRKVVLCHCGEAKQVDITEYLKDISILDPIGGLFKNAIKHTENRMDDNKRTIDKETDRVLEKRNQSLTLTDAEEEVRKAYYKQIPKRAYIRKVELYDLELMETQKDDETLTVYGIRNMFAAFSKYTPTPSSLTRCKFYFASGLYLKDAQHSRFAQYAIPKGSRADYSFNEFESTHVKCSLKDMVLVQQHNKPSSMSPHESQEQMMGSMYKAVMDIFKSNNVLTPQGGIEVSCVYNDWFKVSEQIWKVYLNNLSKCWIAGAADSIQPYRRKAMYLAAVLVILSNANKCIRDIRFDLPGTLVGYPHESKLILDAQSFYLKLKEWRSSNVLTKDKKKKHGNKAVKFPAVFLNMDYKKLLQDRVTVLNSEHNNYTVNCCLNTDKINEKDADNVAEDKVAISFSIFELKDRIIFEQLLLHFHRLACCEKVNDTFVIDKQLYFEYSPQGNLVCLQNPPYPDFTLMTNIEFMKAWAKHRKHYILSKFVKDANGVFIETMDLTLITTLLEKQGIRKEQAVSSPTQVTGKGTGIQRSSSGSAGARVVGSRQAAPAQNSSGAFNDFRLSSLIQPAARQRIMDALVALNHYLEVNNLDLTNALNQLIKEAQANNMQGAHACPICETAFDICSDGGDLLYPSHSFCECQPPLCQMCILDPANSVNDLCKDCQTYGIFPLTHQTAQNLGVLKAFVDSFRRDPREFVIGKDMMVHVKTLSKGLKAVVLEEEDKEDEQPPTLSQSDNRGRITRTEQSFRQGMASRQPVPLQNRSGKVEQSLVPPWMQNHDHSLCKGESPCSFERLWVSKMKLRKTQDREEDQAYKPRSIQEEEKKREVDNEAASAIKKRDAKQATKSHLSDSQLQREPIEIDQEVPRESRQSRPKDQTQRFAQSQHSSPQQTLLLPGKVGLGKQQEQCKTMPPKGVKKLSKLNSSLYIPKAQYSNVSHFNYSDYSNTVPKTLQLEAQGKEVPSTFDDTDGASNHDMSEEMVDDAEREGEGEGEGISNQVGQAN